MEETHVFRDQRVTYGAFIRLWTRYTYQAYLVIMREGTMDVMISNLFAIAMMQ